MEYLKLYLGLLISSPFLYMLVSLNFGLNTVKTNIIVLVTYITVFFLATIMFNYLEYGVIYKPKSKKG